MKSHIFFLTLLTVICPAIAMEEGNDDNNNNNNSNIELQRKLAESRRIREEQDHEFAETLRKDQKRKHERKLEGEGKRLRTVQSKEEIQDDQETEKEKMRQNCSRRFDSNNNNNKNQSLSQHNPDGNYFDWLPNELIMKIIMEHGVSSLAKSCEYPEMMRFIASLKTTNKFFYELLNNEKSKKLISNDIRQLVKDLSDGGLKARASDYIDQDRDNEDFSRDDYVMPLNAIIHDIDFWFVGYLAWLNHLGSSVNHLYDSHVITEYPLGIAAENGSCRVAKMLLDQGANVNACGLHTPLTIAALYGRYAMAKFLLDRGADMEIVDYSTSESRTALMNAVSKVAFESAQIEAEKEEEKMEEPTIVKLLLERGAKVNAQNRHGHTALMIAAQTGWKKAIELLLQYGANINAQDEEGDTALIVAIKNSHGYFRLDLNTSQTLRAIKPLLKLGANPNIRNKRGESALSLTYINELKQLLKNHGATEE